ncbi:MAG TPA: hypothetical protein GXX46_06285 [Peptococcaceae bacterium]|nr:hypothetical protein [Peptococcaceae bacterium]
MDREEFLKLSDDEKFNFLNAEASAGKSFNQIQSDLGVYKEELARIGFYYVGNKFMRKPMKGYRTTQRSGNEKLD